jgi:hypothetical protein
MIEQFAYIYVNYLEPTGKVLFYLFIALVLFYIINVIRDKKKLSDGVSYLISFIIKSIIAILVMCGNLVKWIAKKLLNGIKLIWAAVRDFFFSSI